MTFARGAIPCILQTQALRKTPDFCWRHRREALYKSSVLQRACYAGDLEALLAGATWHSEEEHALADENAPVEQS